MRSIDTILDDKGNQYLLKDLDKTEENQFGEIRIQEKYDIDLNISELNNFLKRKPS